MGFPYFYGRAAEQYAFYRIPKLLFSDERFEALSTDAKLLYGIPSSGKSARPPMNYRFISARQAQSA